MAPPLSGGFLREVYAPLPAGFVFPYFEHFSFFDHRGSFREAWAEPACSVCDRPTDVEPSEGNYHFVMDVYEFLAVYPFPIGTQVNSVTCTFTTYAQHQKWKQFFLDGSILATADQLLFMLYVGSRSACEHSPSILRDIADSSRIWDTLQKCLAKRPWSKPLRFFCEQGKRSPRPPHPPPGGRS